MPTQLPQYKITTHDLKEEKGHEVHPRPRILVAQPNWVDADWKKSVANDLYFHTEFGIKSARVFVWKNLEKAASEKASLVLFPELSVPEDMVEEIRTWTTDNECIVIAGSHYTEERISRCPVIYNGHVEYTHKIYPSIHEQSTRRGGGMSSGSEILLFTNTYVGNFAVLICADYLSDEQPPKNRLFEHEAKLDFLFIPAFQEDSKKHHVPAAVDCQRGIFIVYANNHIEGKLKADARSALFGTIYKGHAGNFIDRFTDGQPEQKLVEIGNDHECFQFTADITRKAHTVPARVGETEAAIVVEYPEDECAAKAYANPPRNFPTLPERNAAFTGREDQLKTLHANFRDGKTMQVIHGLSAVGKTQAAIEYAHRHTQDYNTRLFINAESDIRIFHAYMTFATEMKIARSENRDAIVAAVKRWMQENDKWLFLFDNAEDKKPLEPYLPTGLRENRHILVTSQKAFWNPSSSVEMKPFDLQESIKFFENYNPELSTDGAAELAEELGHLPLALDHAAAYCLRLGETYSKYLQLFRSDKKRLHAEHPLDDTQKTILTTWNIALGKIKNEGASQLLELCAFFAADNIDREWFTEAHNVLPEPLRDIVQDRIKFNEILKEVTDYSLVKLDSGKMSMHRLLQDVVYKEEPVGSFVLCFAILYKIKKYNFSTSESRAAFVALSPHIISVIKHFKSYNWLETGLVSIVKPVLELHIFLGHGFDEFANYHEALKWYEEAFVICKKVFGEEHLFIAKIYNSIASIYSHQSNYEEALKWYKKALALYEKVLGIEDSATATVYNNIATIYNYQANYTEALKWFEKALDIYEKTLGKEHPHTASTYNNIATIYINQADYSVALKWCRKALVIHEKVLGKEHPCTATTYNNMALFYHKQDNYSEALKWYERAQAIIEKALGKEHPRTASAYNNIAALYGSQGNYPKSLEWFEKARVIFEKLLGEEHSYTATIYHNIADLHDRQGKYLDALKLFERALLIREKVLGKEHPDTATLYKNIAAIRAHLESQGS